MTFDVAFVTKSLSLGEHSLEIVTFVMYGLALAYTASNFSRDYVSKGLYNLNVINFVYNFLTNVE